MPQWYSRHQLPTPAVTDKLICANCKSNYIEQFWKIVVNIESWSRELWCVQINRAVEAWDPLKEAIPVHAWLHPWLPWLGPRLESLYPTIRFRLANALQAWHPSDGSALSLLEPWHKVASQKNPHLPLACPVSNKRKVLEIPSLRDRSDIL